MHGKFDAQIDPMFLGRCDAELMREKYWMSLWSSAHNPGFVGRHYDADTITVVLQGVTMGKFFEHAARGFAKKGLHPDQSTMWRWAKHFGGMLKTLSNSVARLAGYDWSADEICYRVKEKEMWLYRFMMRLCKDNSRLYGGWT